MNMKNRIEQNKYLSYHLLERVVCLLLRWDPCPRIQHRIASHEAYMKDCQYNGPPSRELYLYRGHTLNLNSQVFNNTFSSPQVSCGRERCQSTRGHMSRFLMASNGYRRIFHPLKRLNDRDRFRDNLLGACVSLFSLRRYGFFSRTLATLFSFRGDRAL